VLSRIVLKPWSSPDTLRSTPRQLVFMAALFAGSAAMVLQVVDLRASVNLLEVGMLAVLCFVGDFLEIRVSERWSYSCADVFYVLALAVLRPSEAALVIAIVFVVNALISVDSWLGIVYEAGCLLPGALAIVAVWEARASIPDWSYAATGVALVVAAFLGIRIGEFVTFVGVNVCGCERTVGRRLASSAQEAFGYVVGPEALAQLAALAPMALVGTLAWPASRWAAPLLVVPYVVAWRSMRREAALIEAERAAGTDVLTGLSNRGRFFERANAEIELARRYGHGLAFIMGDLDYFKRVNDTHGHIAGDEVLRGTAQALQRVIDDEVFPLARYGGEEFVVVVPVLGREQVLDVAESVRAEVEAALGEWSTTISLGVAYLADSSDRLESLVDRADKALYSAKYAGKNRVHEWRDELDRPVAAADAA
jgi:diguanylate cyclase (GGDEF)-like protein